MIVFGGYDRQVTLTDISNPANPKILPNPIHAKNSIRSITKISDTVIAFGGEDGEITLADISNPYHPTIISSTHLLDKHLWEVETKEHLKIVSKDPLDPQTLYNYAWFVNDKGECVPYYVFNENEMFEFRDEKRQIVLYKEPKIIKD
ncbi:MAG: hypothetical protein DSY46_06090 [Hydrogenimonas sp.]|nr:MAG: hypothetical protein DSY46_06090 [Hydrogenimonas sp.]